MNEAGTGITGEAIKRFDTDGSPLMTGAVKWTSKGQVEKVYQTPYGQAKELATRKKISKAAKEQIDRALTYFTNHQHQMNYADYRLRNLPIDSGVTEAACKTLIKHRLCAAGIRWREHGASLVLSLRALVLPPERWDQFWNKVNCYGFSFA